MLGTVLHGPGNIRCEEVDDPKIQKPTDAIIKLSASCVCGSDLWPYRGLQPMNGPAHMGHEYCGVVVEVGSEVKTIRPGQFVVGSFCISDNTCPHCRFGFPSSCEHREFMSGAQAPYARVPLADGTLVATAEMPSDDLIPSLLATSDVLGTGWYAADAARVQPGATAVVVGDGAVGLMGVLAAKQMGAGRIIAMSRHKARQELALEFGATDTSSPSAAMMAPRRLGNSRTASARSQFSSVSAPRNRCPRRLIARDRAARSGLWVFRTACSLTARTCFSPRKAFWAGRHRCGSTSPISSTS